MKYPSVSILVPMRNEAACIADCLADLCAQDYPADQVEILVIDGDSTDDSPAIVDAITAQHPRVRRLHNPKRLQAPGLNLGIAEAAGDIIIRADAHARYGPTFLTQSVTPLQDGIAECVGGGLQHAISTTPFGAALVLAYRTPLGSGGAAYRVATTPGYVDTVWPGAWKAETLRKLGGFAEELLANEDYELNYRLRERGGRVWLDPTLPCSYYAPSTAGQLWRQYFRYGMGKVRMLRRHPGSLAPRQLLPALFLPALLLAWLFLPISVWPTALVGGLYLLAVLLSALRHPRHFPRLLAIYPTMHHAWGLGFWWEILRGDPKTR